MMNQPQPQYGGNFPQQQQKGCLGRNWKWMLPVGCLGLILLVVAFGVGVFFFAMSAVKSSEVYQYALAKAKADPAVIAELGQPIKDGWLVQGSISTSGDTGHANIRIPINGPKKSGTIYAVASKGALEYASDDWIYEILEVEVEGRPEPIPLIEKKSLTSQTNEDVDGDSGELNEIGPPPPPIARAAPTPSAVGKTISGGVLNGKAISKPAPPYPAIAKAARASGTVTVQVLVDESGNVVSASPVSGHPLLQNAAVQAARQAKFPPTKLSGVAVKVSGVLTYNFVLE
ncbi:MAG TPA: cytochrome c oxidase assembly factor Coa1 family protein [Pyrinomonadaceae bacterium]|nr:cytochrome c oxidase assembly factor Coa1 family protein [Pyrinomonadaceae bacterium]